MVKFIKPGFFGVLAVSATWLSTVWPKTLGLWLLIGALPLWILFVIFIVQALKPE